MNTDETNLKIMQAVDEWFRQHISYFHTDTYYGIDMSVELFQFVRDLHNELNT